jgi:hypothetical protein
MRVSMVNHTISSVMMSRLRMARPVIKWVYLSLHVPVSGSIQVILTIRGEEKRESEEKREREVKREREEKRVKEDETKEQRMAIEGVLVRSKFLTKVNEDRDIECLLTLLSDERGKEMRQRFYDAFPGKEIVGARRCEPLGGIEEKGGKKEKGGKAGSRSAHYDFQVEVADKATGLTKWLHVEHKGSSVYKPIDEALPPWTGGVQFFNGGLEKYRLCRNYAEQWYERFIGSGFLVKEYGLDGVPVPTLDEWMMRDAKVQGDPKTAFGLSLKRAVRASGKESLRDLRDAFVPDFVASLTERDEVEFMEDVFPVLQASLAQKDVWLQVAGDVHKGLFHCRWSPALSVSSVTGVRFSGKKDVVGELVTDCAWPIRFILRWGKGAGFSNLRLDLK